MVQWLQTAGGDVLDHVDIKFTRPHSEKAIP
jgi:hypothetical protein